jgi:hypothetical protein
VSERRIHHDCIREQVGVGDDHAPTIVGTDERRAGLNVLDRAFIIAGDNLIADAERLGDEDQDACQKILEDVPERKPDGDAADAKDLHDVARPEGRQGDGERDEQAEKDDEALSESADGHSRISMCMEPGLGQPRDDSLDDCRHQEEATEHDQRHNDAGDCRHNTVDDRLCSRERRAEVQIHGRSLRMQRATRPRGSPTAELHGPRRRDERPGGRGPEDGLERSPQHGFQLCARAIYNCDHHGDAGE